MLRHLKPLFKLSRHYHEPFKKVVVVTGASQGLGAGIVEGFRKLGYQVVATSRSIQPSSDPDILTVAGDIADPATSEKIIREGVARLAASTRW
jgi:NAD(P)-dependent dehydrogenase (short-subunit alcohol dehydrogenase family)